MTRARGREVRRNSPIARRSDLLEASRPALHRSASANWEKSCARAAESCRLSRFSPALTPCPPTISKSLRQAYLTRSWRPCSFPHSYLRQFCGVPETYRIAVELPSDPITGKRQRHWETFHGTKKEANKRLTVLQGFVDQGRLGANSKMILTDFLDLWLEQHADTKADKTSLRYYQIVQHQLKPHLGPVRLDLLTAAVISGLDKKLRAQNLAPQTRQHAHRVLHTALKYALTLRLIVSHPMDGLQAPSVPKKEMQVLDVAEARRFLETCRTAQLQRWTDPDRLKWLAFFSVALNTGMRVSELRGLRWQDVDYEASELRIRQNALRIPKVGWVRKSTKTSGSVRSISIDAALLDLLKRHQPQVMKLRVLSPKFAEYDLVFPSEAGTPLEDRRIHYVFKHLRELTGVKKIRPYDLHHCCATLLLSAGVNPKVVQERLGPVSVTLTLQTYSHVLPNIQKDAANTLGKLLG